MLHNYPWSPFYVSAVLETNPSQMPNRIQEAERAIDERRSHYSEIDSGERQAMKDAATTLRVLRLERV
jgi:hypothetical protein